MDELAQQLAIYIGAMMRHREAEGVIHLLQSTESLQVVATNQSAHASNTCPGDASISSASAIVAYLNGRTGGRQMRPRSEFLRALGQDADLLRRAKFTSFYTPLDLMFVPARSSSMPQAHNVRIWAALHPSLILEAGCIRAVADALKK